MNRRQKLIQKQFLNNEEELIKKLEKIYGEALTDIDKKISKLTFTINDLKLEYSWLDDGDPEKARIKSMIQAKIYQKEYQEQLRKQVDGILKRMDVVEFVTISDYLDTCYSDAFIGTIFDAHGQGVPIMAPINQEAMVRAVQLESKISKGLYTRLGEDVNRLKVMITSEVSRGISTGMTYKQVAKQLENQTKVGYNRAIRIARTEGHRIQCTATMDAMEVAKERGADVIKQWDATLDARTRDSHAKVDGEIREIDKRFSNGLMFPGDPNGRPEEVINCRCALLQRARWALEDGFTKFNNFTGQLESFESPDDYGKFKKAFFSKDNRSYMKYVDRMETKYETKDFKKLLGEMTDKEYDEFALMTAKNPIFNMKGLENYGKSGIMRWGVIRDSINSNSVSLTINADKQNKHIIGSDKFIEGRSRLTVGLDEAQKIVNELSGTGNPVFDGNGDWTHKERVIYSDYVGIHVDTITGEETKTNKFLIIYSNTGTHIVPRLGDD